MFPLSPKIEWNDFYFSNKLDCIEKMEGLMCFILEWLQFTGQRTWALNQLLHHLAYSSTISLWVRFITWLENVRSNEPTSVFQDLSSPRYKTSFVSAVHWKPITKIPQPSLLPQCWTWKRNKEFAFLTLGSLAYIPYIDGSHSKVRTWNICSVPSTIRLNSMWDGAWTKIALGIALAQIRIPTWFVRE